VRFDARRVWQILDAIVDNAVKFTPQGSHIVLRAAIVEEESKSWLKIEVEDDGPGIDPDQIPVLFDSFRQLDGTTTRAIGGLGIGLALAKSLAQRMGGDLRMRSEVGRGSVFSLLLPTVEG
jgi:signal transduction histidine kinase